MYSYRGGHSQVDMEKKQPTKGGQDDAGPPADEAREHVKVDDHLENPRELLDIVAVRALQAFAGLVKLTQPGPHVGAAEEAPRQETHFKC